MVAGMNMARLFEPVPCLCLPPPPPASSHPCPLTPAVSAPLGRGCSEGTMPHLLRAGLGWSPCCVGTFMSTGSSYDL